MKKIITLLLLSVISASTFAYTSTDVSGANYLASKRIIKDWSSEPKNYRFDDYIARSEIMGMVLAMNGIIRNTHCRGDFVDVPKSDTDWVCRTIETAADKWFINAKPSGMKIRPYDHITRAEALWILSKNILNSMDGWAGYNYYWSSSLPNDDSTTGYKDIYPFGAQWQASVFYEYIQKVLQDTQQLRIDPRANEVATRREVFDFAYKIFQYKWNIILSKLSEDERYVKYEWTIQVSGKYEMHTFFNKLCFYVDEKTAYLIPRDPNMFGSGNGDTRDAWFCFSNQNTAKEKLAFNSCNKGNATIEINSYTVDKLESEVFDTAALIKVVNMQSWC
jgi:hypothetical protein